MIPRKIWQIWIGDKPLPEREAGWCYALKQMNPTWEWKLWGNELLETYGRDPYVKDLLAKGEKLAFVSDRLRVLLLRDHGGIYLDTDCQPIRPLDTLKFWDQAHVDFAFGTRDPIREGVALWRGVAYADNTMLASKRNGRLVNKLLDLWRPESPKVTGHRTGICLLREQRPWDTIPLPFPYFYDMQVGPETICLHDCHNAGTWVDDKTPMLTIKSGEHHVAEV